MNFLQGMYHGSRGRERFTEFLNIEILVIFTVFDRIQEVNHALVHVLVKISLVTLDDIDNYNATCNS